MICYEVSIDVPLDDVAAYRVWLHEHVHEMLALPGFHCARMQSVLPAWLESAPSLATAPPPVSAPSPTQAQNQSQTSALHRFVVSYWLLDAAALTRYLSEFAPALRARAPEFGRAFAIHRRVLELELKLAVMDAGMAPAMAPVMAPVTGAVALDAGSVI